MGTPAVFFDRDNTLIVSDGYLGDPNGVVLIDGAAEAIARVRELGFIVVTISNQSGVARGLFGEDVVAAVDQKMDDLLQAENSQAIIERHEFCPFHPEAIVDRYRQDSDLRKPRPGMILRAARAMNLDLPASWVVGDAPRDIEAGKAAHCRTILITDPKLSPSPATRQISSASPDATVANLLQAIAVIEKEMQI